MSKIFLPNLIVGGVVGYLGILYLSARYDRAKQKPKTNYINLADRIPNIQGIDLQGEINENLRQYYSRIDYFINILQSLTVQRKKVVTDLLDKNRFFHQLKKNNKQKHKYNKKQQQEQKLQLLEQHTRINYYHANQIIFEDSYLYGLVKLTKRLDLITHCKQLVPNVNHPQRKNCQKVTYQSQNIIKHLLYRNTLGNETTNLQ